MKERLWWVPMFLPTKPSYRFIETLWISTGKTDSLGKGTPGGEGRQKLDISRRSLSSLQMKDTLAPLGLAQVIVCATDSWIQKANQSH